MKNKELGEFYNKILSTIRTDLYLEKLNIEDLDQELLRSFFLVVKKKKEEAKKNDR